MVCAARELRMVFTIFIALLKKKNKNLKVNLKKQRCQRDLQSLKYLLSGPLQKRLVGPWAKAVFYHFHSEELAVNFLYGSKRGMLLLKY